MQEEVKVQLDDVCCLGGQLHNGAYVPLHYNYDALSVYASLVSIHRYDLMHSGVDWADQ